jgi:hypothetical protein
MMISGGLARSPAPLGKLLVQRSGSALQVIGTAAAGNATALPATIGRHRILRLLGEGADGKPYRVVYIGGLGGQPRDAGVTTSKKLFASRLGSGCGKHACKEQVKNRRLGLG